MNQTKSPIDYRALIAAECDAIKEMLLAKNASYGNSVFEPVRAFSKASPIEQILVRIDDKLSRILKGHEYVSDDTSRDLIGYLILLLVAYRCAEAEHQAKPIRHVTFPSEKPTTTDDTPSIVGRSPVEAFRPCRRPPPPFPIPTSLFDLPKLMPVIVHENGHAAADGFGGSDFDQADVDLIEINHDDVVP